MLLGGGGGGVNWITKCLRAYFKLALDHFLLGQKGFLILGFLLIIGEF